MSTPPSWAYPYATFWEDFEGPYQITGDSSSTSGGEWLSWPFDPDTEQDPTSLYRGATGGGRTGVGAPLLVHFDAYLNSGSQGFARARAVASGLGANNAYVRSDIFFGRGDGFGGIVYWHLTLFMDSNPYGTQFECGVHFDLVNFPGGQAWVVAGLFVGTLAPPWTENGFENLFQVPLTWADLTGWHRYELRLADGEVKLLMDDVVVGSAANPLPGQVPQGVGLDFDGGISDTPYPGTDAGGVNLADNFEAGPLSLPAAPVPVLQAAPGPTSLLFEPPRLNT